MTLVIRSARADDSERLAPLLAQLGYPAEPAAVSDWLDRLLSSGADTVLIAVLDGEAAGLLCLHLLSVIHDPRDFAWITALVVSERARRRGVGRRLVERAEEVARECECTRVVVTTHLRRGDAHAFYEGLGFEFTGRRYVRYLR